MVFRRVTAEEARKNVAVTSASGPNFTATKDLYNTAGVTAPAEALQAAAALDRSASRQQRNRIGLPSLSLGLASRALALSQVGRQERLQAQLDEITRPVRNEEERLARIRARAATRSTVANASKAELSLELERRTLEDRVAGVRAQRQTQEEQLATQQERTRGAAATADRGEFDLSEEQRLAPLETRRRTAIAATAEEGLTRSRVQTDTARTQGQTAGTAFRRGQVAEEQARVGLADAQEGLVSNRQLRSNRLRVSALSLQKVEAENAQRESVQAYASAYAESGMSAAQLVDALATAPSLEEREALQQLIDPLLGTQLAVNKAAKAGSDAKTAEIGVGAASSAARKARLSADAAKFKADLQTLVPLLAQDPDAALKASQGEPVPGLENVPSALLYEAGALAVKTQDAFDKRKNDLAAQEIALAEGRLSYSQEVEEEIIGSVVAADYLAGGAIIGELGPKGYEFQVDGKTQYIPLAKLQKEADVFATQAGEASAERAERAAINSVQENRLQDMESRISLVSNYTQAPIPASAARKIEAAKLMNVTGEDPAAAKELLQQGLAEAAAAIPAPTPAQQNTASEIAAGSFISDSAIVASLEQYHELDEEAVADHFSTRPLAGATMDAVVQQAHNQRGWAEYLGRNLISISREDANERAARTYVNAYGVDKAGVEDPKKVRGTNRAIKAATQPILYNAVASGLAGSLAEITRDISNPELEAELQRFVIQPMTNVDSPDGLDPLIKNMAILERKYSVNLYAALAAAAGEAATSAAGVVRQQMSGPSLGTIIPLAKAYGVKLAAKAGEPPFTMAIEDIAPAVGAIVASRFLQPQINAYSSVHKVDAVRQVYEGATVLSGGENNPILDGDDEAARTALAQMSIDDSAYLYALDANLEAAFGPGTTIDPTDSAPSSADLRRARTDATIAANRRAAERLNNDPNELERLQSTIQGRPTR